MLLVTRLKVAYQKYRQYKRQYGHGQILLFGLAALPFFSGICARLLSKRIPPEIAQEILERRCACGPEPLVSVLIPVHNGVADGLERLLQSVHSQTHKNIEIIAVNTESTDDSVALLERYGARVLENAMKDFRHDRVRNMAADAATGEFLLFTVCDACFDEPDWIAKGLRALEAFEGDSYSTRQRWGEDAEPYAKLMSYNLSKSACPMGGVYLHGGGIAAPVAFRLAHPHLKTGAIHVDDVNHLVRSKTFLKLRYRTHTCEDMDFGRRLMLSGGRFIHSDLSSVLHYHSYRNYSKYFSRVLVDVGVITPLIFSPVRRQENGLVDGQVAVALAIFAEVHRHLEGVRQRFSKGISLGAKEEQEVLADIRGALEQPPSKEVFSEKRVAEFEKLFGLRRVACEIDHELFINMRNMFLRILSVNVENSTKVGVTSLSVDEYAHLARLTFIAIFASMASHSVYFAEDRTSVNVEILRPRAWQ
jgi:glycosyltransferase involved in cell wall biosynthesis